MGGVVAKQRDGEARADVGVEALSAEDFLAALTSLEKGWAAEQSNPGSYQCVGCTRCAGCTFCRDCDGCFGCNHCVRCEGCTNCSHCVDAKNCHGCTHVVRSENCTDSAYLVLCRDLSECTYCFGCVGLQRKDFHILNQPYSRTEYFARVEKLKRALGLP